MKTRRITAHTLDPYRHVTLDVAVGGELRPRDFHDGRTRVWAEEFTTGGVGYLPRFVLTDSIRYDGEPAAGPEDSGPSAADPSRQLLERLVELTGEAVELLRRLAPEPVVVTSSIEVES